MVTIEILKQSQRTRPRKWVRNFGWIFIWPMIAILMIMLGTIIPNYFLNGIINQFDVDFFGHPYKMMDFLQYLIIPATLWVVGFFPLALSQKMGKYRHPYWLLFIPAVIVTIVYPLGLLFIYLHDFVPTLTDLMNRFIPAQVFAIVNMVLQYVGIGLPILYIVVCIFAIIYNVNYPAKYEDIYHLRKERILSFDRLDERSAYRKRFYEDYKRGNWDSMMFDLHYASLQGASNEPMRDDAYEFLRYVNGRNEDHIHGAILDQYRKEGRYADIRKQYHRNKKL